MNQKLRLLIAAACITPVAAFADATLYGRASVAVTQVSETVTKIDKDTKKDVVTSPTVYGLESYSSRIGLRGSEKLIEDGIELIYQAEYEAAFDDGQTGSTNTGGAFAQRNIFVGVKTDFGQLIGGNFDTPLKTVQKKVDLFNDWRGDISGALSANEKRMSNSVMYTTNKMAGFTGYVDVIGSEKAGIDNAVSLAGSYELGGYYAALAYDHNVRSLAASTPNDVGTSALRLVGQYTISNFQFGLLIDRDHKDAVGVIPEVPFEAAKLEKAAVLGSKEIPANAAIDTTGIMFSTQYTLAKWAFKGEVGKSDNVAKKRDAIAFSLGADYSFSKNSKVYSFYSNERADALAATTTKDGVAEFAKQDKVDNRYLGVGVEMNF